MKLPLKNDLEGYIRPLVKNNVYNAFKKVDRKLFVPKKWENLAYSDNSISLDGHSSISQPTLVAEMIDLLDLKGNERVLEIGTASGYSAAILSLCCKEVDTIEIDPSLSKSARERLSSLGFKNIEVYTGDGSLGLADKAPFDAIVVTAAVSEIPKTLVEPMKEGGRIVVPVQIKGSDLQELILGIKEKGRLATKSITIVKFVPLVDFYPPRE